MAHHHFIGQVPKERRRAYKYPRDANKASNPRVTTLLVNLGGNDELSEPPGMNDMNPQGTRRPHIRIRTQVAIVRESVFCNVPVLDTDIMVKGGRWVLARFQILHREDSSSKQFLRLLL